MKDGTGITITMTSMAQRQYPEPSSREETPNGGLKKITTLTKEWAAFPVVLFTGLRCWGTTEKSGCPMPLPFLPNDLERHIKQNSSCKEALAINHPIQVPSLAFPVSFAHLWKGSGSWSWKWASVSVPPRMILRQTMGVSHTKEKQCTSLLRLEGAFQATFQRREHSAAQPNIPFGARTLRDQSQLTKG